MQDTYKARAPLSVLLLLLVPPSRPAAQSTSAVVSAELQLTRNVGFFVGAQEREPTLTGGALKAGLSYSFRLAVSACRRSSPREVMGTWR